MNYTVLILNIHICEIIYMCILIYCNVCSTPNKSTTNDIYV